MKNLYFIFLLLIVTPLISTAQWHSLYHDAHYEVFAEHSGQPLGIHWETEDELLQGANNHNIFGTYFRFIPNKNQPGYYWIAFERSEFLGSNNNNVYLEAQTGSRPYTLKAVSEKKDDARQMFKLINLRSDLFSYAFQIGSKATEDMGRMELLDVAGSGGAGAQVILYPPSGNENQNFFIRLKGSQGTPTPMTSKGGCKATASASFEGGGVYSVQKEGTTPIVLNFGNSDQIREQFDEMLSVSVRELRDNQIGEIIRIQFDRNCSLKREFYLDGIKVNQVYRGHDIGQDLLEEYIKLEDQLDYLLTSDRDFHLVSVKNSTGADETVSYFPFYISHKRRISEVKGTTVTPEIPYLILHAPPGDQSYSYISKEQQICHGMQFSVQKEEGEEVYASARLGAKGSLGIIAETEYEAYGEISGSMTMSTSTTENGGNEVCFTTSETFSTTSDNGLVGSEGDVFVGFAMSVDYGTSNYLERGLEDPNNPVFKADLVLAASTDPSQTKEFMYTESHIRNVKMAKLVEFINDPSTPGALVEDYKDQLKMWQQVLQINEDIKNNPGATVVSDLLFSSFTSKDVESTVTTSSSRSFEFTMEVSREVGVEVGAYVGGSGGMGGYKIQMRSEIGSSVSNSSTHSNTIGYHLEDDDEGDEFDIQVLSDPVFGTPLFRINENGTSTSCPYEGGYQRDQPFLDVATSINGNYGSTAQVTGVPLDQPALFYINVHNLSNETRDYKLRVDAKSVKKGEKITVGGSLLLASGDPLPYDDLGGQSTEQGIQVSFEAGPDKSITEYGPIPLILYSECEPEIESIIYLNVIFDPSTSTLNHQKEELGFDIYPNPSRGMTHFDFHQSGVQGTMEIINLQGQVLMQKSISPNQGRFNEDLNFLPNGVYQVRVRDENGQFMRKLIKN